MSDINGQESISVGFYNSLLGVGSGHSTGDDSPQEAADDTKQGNARQVRMSNVPSNYNTISRLIDETDDRIGRTAEEERNLSGLTKRLAEMFEQKQELVAELRNERIKAETFESERDDLSQRLDKLTVDYDQAMAQVEQAQAARKRAAEFMEEAKEAARRVIVESQAKVKAAENERSEAQRAYDEEHDCRRNLEQLLQEMRAESDTMSDQIASLSNDLRDTRQAKDETAKRLMEAEIALDSLHAENEAHVSRINHLTERNELLARNLQSMNMTHGELQRQFDATAVSNAALSADYESLMRRCTDAETERDRLMAEATQRADLTTGELTRLEGELNRARDVIALLRPIIEKAGIGDLRKGDIRLLDERLSAYEATTSGSDGLLADVEPNGVGSAMPSYQPSYTTSGTHYSQSPAPSGSDENASMATTTSDPSSTADLYAAFEQEIGSMEDNQGPEDMDSQVEQVSFVNMFGKPHGSGSDGDGGEYQFETFDDYDDEFGDLDEPDEATQYASDDATDGSDDYDFDISDIYGESGDKGNGEDGSFAFPQDLKRGDNAQPTSHQGQDDGDIDAGGFELDSLTDFNAIMANFAHYTAENFEE